MPAGADAGGRGRPCRETFRDRARGGESSTARPAIECLRPPPARCGAQAATGTAARAARWQWRLTFKLPGPGGRNPGCPPGGLLRVGLPAGNGAPAGAAAAAWRPAAGTLTAARKFVGRSACVVDHL